jgi:hypothetical protein
VRDQTKLVQHNTTMITRRGRGAIGHGVPEPTLRRFDGLVVSSLAALAAG